MLAIFYRSKEPSTLDTINEIELREIMRMKLSPKDQVGKIMRRIQDATLSWEEKRPFWNYLFATGRSKLLMEGIVHTLKNRQRIPFDLMVEILARANVQPPALTLKALVKGIERQNAAGDLICSRGWDKWEPQLDGYRSQFLDKMILEQRQQKDLMLEKFHFLQSQRMTEQAGRVLKRLLDIYPEEKEFHALKEQFDESWARDVISQAAANIGAVEDSSDLTLTQPSPADQEMLRAFLIEGEKLALHSRQLAYDLAIAFMIMEDNSRALDILAWAEPGASTDWLRVELLFQSRRFVEALDELSVMEIKYVSDPETTFSVSYLRALCLYNLAQRTLALEIMQSIVRIRPQYRSAHAFILKWMQSGEWK